MKDTNASATFMYPDQRRLRCSVARLNPSIPFAKADEAPNQRTANMALVMQSNFG